MTQEKIEFEKIYVEEASGSNIYDLLKNCKYRTSSQLVATYRDEACKILQCKAGYRSFEDLYDLARTYYPDTTQEELAGTLFLLNQNGLGCLFCNDIRKLVFHYNASEKFRSRFLTNSQKDDKGIGKYSIREIYNLAGKDITKD